ncbi:MAG: tetratricopeptide repeat protein [Gemmataceae bacterium]|nr:tetratricopeptide repeat protein [Gemmataceae bacterium]
MFPLPFAQLAQPTSADLPGWILYGAAALLVVVVLVGGWLAFGRGPRMRRGLRRVGRLRQAGEWRPALALVRDLQLRVNQASVWASRLRTAESACLSTAGAAAIAAGDYEKGLEYRLNAVALVGLGEAAVRAAVIEQMLAEVRRLFAGTAGNDTAPVHEMLTRVLLLQAACPEASFWKGLCHVREGSNELALNSFLEARGSDPAALTHLDPSLYVGGLLLRQGQPKEALRFFTEANRLDSNCPLVTLHLGRAMIEAGGDAQIAVRAMQRALGQRGLLIWASNPERLWVEGFPEGRSFVRKLASAYRYVCPLWGADLHAILRDGQTALGHGLYRLGQFQESADVFTKLMGEAAPSVAVLRGLGLALARLGRYDQAFKHLRTAHELEEPKDRLTAGYLALCGAQGKPARPEDKVRNVTWAVRVVSKFNAPGDREWADLLDQIFAEVRTLDIALPVEDHLYLCEHLLSVNATDPQAAAAYHHFQAAYPEALHAEYAWLYCRAAHLHDLTGPHALTLFARTFAEIDRAREFFAARGWDFDEVEYAFLAQAAAQEPGRFPEVFGPAYPSRGEAFLLARATRAEEAGHLDGALATAEVLHRLAPRSPQAFDLLARLHYRCGNPDQARELLQGWHELEPAATTPLLRLAVVLEQLGRPGECLESIRKALALMHGPARADAAFLGARLVLTSLNRQGEAARNQPEALRPAVELLEECLRERPDHEQALWVLAAMRAVAGDRQQLATHAGAMNQPAAADARFHYLAGVARLAAGDYDGAIQASRRAAEDPTYALDSAYLAGWASLHRREPAAAAEAFRLVAKAADNPSASHAQAILGAVRFHEGVYEEAVHWWKALTAEKRRAWGFDDPLQKTMFLAALSAYQSGRYEQAAEKLREAGRLGLRDRRLGPLLMLSLLKAGQRLLYRT